MMPVLKYRHPTLGWQSLSAGERGAPGIGVPIGAVTPFAGSSAPTGWLMCDGTAVSRAIYLALFAVIGVTYGVGDNSTTFNLPSLQGRVPVGAGPQTFASPVGKYAGAETHALATTEIPAHQHQVVGPAGHTWGSTYAGTTQATFAFAPYSINSANTFGLLYADGQSGTTNQPHNNMQPYVVMNYIIRA
jgi:microcystin-dependent protein